MTFQDWTNLAVLRDSRNCSVFSSSSIKKLLKLVSWYEIYKNKNRHDVYVYIYDLYVKICIRLNRLDKETKVIFFYKATASMRPYNA